MAKFVQLIEFSTNDIAAFNEAGEEWMAATAGQRTATWEIAAADRDQPNRYVQIVAFPSYEDAMKNNDLPATAEVAKKMQALCDGPISFRNLDVVEERDLS